MKKYLSLTITFVLTSGHFFGQTKKLDSADFAKLPYKENSVVDLVPTTGERYVDGFRIYSNLTKQDSTNILKDFSAKLNGCWAKRNNRQQKFNVSLDTFDGTWFTKGIHSTAPLIRLRIIDGQIKLIVTDVIGGDGNPRGIKIHKNKLTIQYDESKKTFSYKRLKTCI